MLRIGVISDTHGLVRPEALAALAGVVHIIHAGDIGSEETLATFQAIAPTSAVRGNNDTGRWAERLPLRLELRFEQVRVLICHDRADLAPDEPGASIDLVICGHSHRPEIGRIAGARLLNPGSAGPARFSLTVSLAELIVEGTSFEARLLNLPQPARDRPIRKGLS